MYICSTTNKIQKRIIDIMDNYLLDVSTDEPTLSDLEEYVADKLGRDEFNFKEVSDSLPIISKLKEMFSDIDLPTGGSISHYSNILKNVKSFSMNDLFHGMPSAKIEFNSYLKKIILGDGILGKNNDDTYAFNSEKLNDNFIKLKSDLFDNIQKFLIDKRLYNGDILPLYNEENVANYSNYINIMNIIDNYFFNNPEIPTTVTYDNRKVPNLSIATNRNMLEAYYNMLLLSNFDTIVSTKFGSFIKVNLNKFNLLDNGLGDNLKYSLNFDPIRTAYWNKDTHEAENSEDRTDDFTRNLINLIPLYNKQGTKTQQYMEVNDFYLIAAKLSEFELLEGNRLKNTKTNFEYFNTDPVKRFKWYLENIKKSINREPNSIQELSKYFSPIYDKILSIDKFIYESEYNIAKKEENTGNSILTYMAQVINNNFGASYSSYNTSGNYSIQQMYSQDFDSTRVQSTVFSTLKMHYADKEFYNISSDPELSNFEKLFPKNVSSIKDVLSAINSGEIDYNAINKYITSKTGIAMTKTSLVNTIKDVSIHNKDGNPVTGIEFKSMLRELMMNLNADFKSDLFVKTVALSNDKSVRLDSTVGEYLTNTVKNPLFIALKNSYTDKFTVKVVMNAETSNGNSIPSFKIGNFTYKDTESFDLRRQYEMENPNNLYKSLLIKDTPAILGTLTKLEVISNNRAKEYSKLTPEEQFTSDFNYDFLKNIVNNKAFSVILGNYSDKSTILAKIINSNFRISDDTGRLPIVKESIDTILETVRVQTLAYYSDLINQIFTDYKNIFNSLGIKNNIDLNWRNDDIKFENNINEINGILQINSISSINDKLANLPIENRPQNLLTQELHYSKYKNGIYLNSYILDNYRVFSDSSKDGLFYNMFVNRTENSFIKKFSKFSKPDSLGIDSLEVDQYLSALGINRNEFKTISEDRKTEYSYNSLLINKKLNPFVKKWMWLNSLFRNEYLYLGVKGEYMHPHKDKSIEFRLGEKNEAYWNSYFLEMSKRMVPLSKRNVTYTASIESPVRNSKRGVPDKINVAAIEDYKTNIYTTAGYSKAGNDAQDAHDGSSMLDYVYSRMIDESFPGKGYSGTKKQFATFVTPYGVTIKKDAESVITNAKILFSNSEISLLNKKKQMLDIPIGNIRLSYNSGSLADYYIIKNGTKLRINSIKIGSDADGRNYVSLNYSKEVKDANGNYSYIGSVDTKQYINSLYDIWTSIGAQYSVDEDGNFNEESNERLYDIVINTNDGILKTKMIHILSNVSALKAGATGINSSSKWTNDTPLLYTSYNSRFMGPQLDASHEADQSEIREVSQVISSLAQGGFTFELANEAYKNIAQVISKSMDKYLKHMGINGVDKKALYNILSNKFIRSIQKSDRNEVTQALIDTLLDNNIPVPFSNQNFYNLYIREIITTLNNDFITRHYPGMGGVLIPSQGIIQLYDVKIGNEWLVVTPEDLAREALFKVNSNFIKINPQEVQLMDIVIIKNVEYKLDTPDKYLDFKNRYSKLKTVEIVPRSTNEQIISDYINNLLKDIEVNSDEIEFGDTVRINGQVISLNTPALYYQFKDNYKNTLVNRVLSKPRDLKPTLHTFNEVVYYIDSNNNIQTREVRKNTFDIQPLSLLYKYTEKILNKDETTLINNIQDSIGNVDIVKFLRGWYQRDLQLLENGLIMRELTLNDDVKEFFKNDDILNDIIQDVLPFYKENNTNKVTNLLFSPAEIMTGDMYKTNFDRDDSDSMYQIKLEKANYFKRKLNTLYDTNDNTKADIKVVTSDPSNPVYIRFVSELTGYNSVNIKRNPDVSTELYSRYDESGNRLYDIIDYKNTRVKLEDGKEIIEVKIGVNNRNKITIIRDAFYNVNKLIKSFSDTKAIVPLGNGTIDIVYSKQATRDEKSSEQNINEPKFYNVNTEIAKIFSNYNGINLANIDTTKKDWFQNNKKIILDRLSNTIYTSWEKSHYVVASRIPSQSMQSFMPMKNVGYIKGGTNDVYVNVNQIFLQGSDFDIDKAYILGNGFLNNGRIDLWTNLSSYSNLDQLNALMKLPLPIGKEVIISKEGLVNPNLENLYNQIAESLKSKSFTYELPTETILLFNKFIRALPETNNDKIIINLTKENENLPFNSFSELVNKHTNYQDYVKTPYSVKNSVVQKINEVISSISNQVNANIPIDVKNMHDTIDKVYSKRSSAGLGGISDDNDLNSYDMLSYYQQQYNASIGKDDVGITANGMKGLMALTTYYNNFFLNTWGNRELSDTELRRSNKLFKRDITFKDDFGNDVKLLIGSITDVLINRKQEAALKRVLGEEYSKVFTNGAVTMSSFVSAATDNAKELIMSKVNASTKLAGMHAYMVVMGFTLDQITEFMTSKVASKIILESTDNIYYDNFTKSITTVIKNLKSNPTIDQSQLAAFEEIYLDSKEFANLTSILGVNQKLKADTWEMFNFLNKFNTALRTAENLAIPEFKDLTKEKFINYVLTYNKLLTQEDSEYIGKIYDDINSLILEDGRKVKIIKNFNTNYYFSSNIYKEAVKKYYNLIKRTFNIFDVIDEVPHFKQMVEGLSMSDKMAKYTAEKYNFSLNTLRNTLNDESYKLTSDKNPKYVSKVNVLKGSNYFDTKATSLWLKTDRMSKYIFDVGKILKQVGINKIDLYKDDSSRYNMQTIEVTQDDDYTINLSTDYGIANFKKLMEVAILPILQQLDNSEAIKSLRVETLTNQFGLKTNAITSSYSLKSLNSAIAIERFDKLINAFNAIDYNILTAGKIQNAYGENLKWKDLLYIYNLVVNNDRYGDKRLTPLFRDYANEKNSLALNYIEFFSKIDDGSVDILYSDLYNSPEYINADDNTKKILKDKYDKMLIDDILFYSFNDRGILEELSSTSSPEIKAQIANPDFVITWNIAGKYDSSYYKMSELLRKINLGGFIVEYNC